MQRPILALVAAAFLAFGLAACSSSSKSSDSGGGTADTITIKDFTFTPPASVKAGATVTVKNNDSTTHTSTADNGEWNTGNVEPGKSVTFTAPSTPGDYPFHCNIHTTMKSTLKVT